MSALKRPRHAMRDELRDGDSYMGMPHTPSRRAATS
jgi:hypothetical protein